MYVATWRGVARKSIVLMLVVALVSSMCLFGASAPAWAAESTPLAAQGINASATAARPDASAQEKAAPSISYRAHVQSIGNQAVKKNGETAGTTGKGLRLEVHPAASGGLAPHGWVEVYQSGRTYVCDPDLAHEIPGHNWFMTTYASAPISYTR